MDFFVAQLLALFMLLVDDFHSVSTGLRVELLELGQVLGLERVDFDQQLLHLDVQIVDDLEISGQLGRQALQILI